MSNNQLYILISPLLVAVFGIFFNAWRTDKRIDDLKAELNSFKSESRSEMNELRSEINRRFDRIELTLEAIRQDLADQKATLKVHDAEIANLKERLKSQG